MKEAVRQISQQYQLELSEEQIQRIAQQAEDARVLFEQLNIDGLDGIMPMPIVSRKQVKR